MALPKRWINVTDPGWMLARATASCDGFVHIILPDRGADDRMDLRGQLLGRGHPVPQGDRHRHDPLARGDPGNDLLDQVGGGLGHAPPGTGGTKPPPLAAEGQQQLVVAGVTAQPQKAMREDAALQVVVQFALPHRRVSLSRRDQRRARRERSPDGRRPPGRAASGSDRVAHTRVVKPPDAVSWWSLRILKVSPQL